MCSSLLPLLSVCKADHSRYRRLVFDPGLTGINTLSNSQKAELEAQKHSREVVSWFLMVTIKSYFD